MADRSPMRDVLFLLPGIGGSILEKNNIEVWSPSPRGIWEFIKTHSKSIETLKLQADDPVAETLDDGVEATRLVEDIHIIPGLWKIDGYTIVRDVLCREFELHPHWENEPGKANYVEVPYDWRRDIRSSARILGRSVERYLGWWRKDQRLPEARAIILAHSMGGLVARYWLEVLGGLPDCKALVTFGTPHRGAPNALRTLANGYKPAIQSITNFLRTCTGVYQLLTIYEMVLAEGKLRRIAETTGIPNLDIARAADALAFHREIEDAVNARDSDNGYALLPLVGTAQPTFQSATLTNSALIITRDLPSTFDPLWAYGDGTVPYASAIPLEMSHNPKLGFIAEQHGSIQCNFQVLQYIREFLIRTQARDLGAVRGTSATSQEQRRLGLSLELEDLYITGEPIQLSVSPADGKTLLVRAQARIEPADGKSEAQTYELYPHDLDWKLTVDNLRPTLYRVNIRAQASGGSSPTPVTGLFEVGE